MKDINVVYDSQNLIYKEPFGAVLIGTNIKINIDINYKVDISIKLIYSNNKSEFIQMREYARLDNGYIRYVADINSVYEVGILEYYFEIKEGNQKIYYGNNKDKLGGIGEIYYNSDPQKYQITVYKDSKIPSWYKEGIMYQIFVDRFYNGHPEGKVKKTKKNCFLYGRWDDTPMYIKDKDGDIIRWDFYGGNLEGIIKKLKYINNLGVSIIYMNPIFESSSCHKYDVGDYEKVDEMFGTIEDFKDLCNEADKLGIKIILDGVFSHTGADSKYFNKKGTYDTVGAYQSQNSKYYSWYRFKEYPEEYECWWGIDNQPNVDELNESYMSYIVNGEEAIVKRWLKYGASGWRLDVADELPDEFIKELRRSIKEIKKDSILIGEVWEDASNKISYGIKRQYLFGDELDSVTNYPLRDIIVSFLIGKIDSRYFKSKIMSIYENYPIENFYACMNLLGSHDTERILTALNEDIGLLKLAITIQMTMPGVPVIYYGDEVGLTGKLDPANRKTYPWGKENNEILEWYKKIIKIRKKEDVLISGKIIFKYHRDEGELVYKRYSEDSEVLVAININSNSIDINLEKESINLIDNKFCKNKITLESKECCILKPLV